MRLAVELDSSLTNATSINNDTSVCHPILLSMGSKSEKGICDDTVAALIFSAIILFIHTVLIIVSIGGLIYKLKKLSQLNQNSRIVNHLQVARNPALMILSALLCYCYTIVISTRVLIGRKIYPCFIFSLVYYLAVPALASAVILRSIRLLVLTRLNDVKI